MSIYTTCEILENIHSHAIVLLDTNGKITDWNAEAVKIFGWEKNEVIGTSLTNYLKDENHQELGSQEIIKKKISNESSEKNFWIKTKSEQLIFVSSYLNATLNSMGQIIGYVNILKNSTSRKMEMDCLQASEIRYKVGAGVTRNAIWDWNIQTDELIWTEALITELRYSSDDLRKDITWWKDRIHPEDRGRVIQGITQHVKSHAKFWNDEYRFRIGDGTYRTFRDRGQLIKKANGGLGMIGAMEDISHEREFSRKIMQSEERMKFALDAAQMGEYEIDLQTNILTPSSQIEQIFGHKKLTGDLFEVIQRVVHPDDVSKTIECKKQAIANGTPYSDEFRIIKFDGSVVWARSQGRAHRDDQGHPNKFYGVIQDITKNKIVEEELKQAKKDAEVANLAKSAFLANMSHEIRTPMTAVLGFTEVLSEPNIPEEVRSDAISRIEGSGKALLRLIEDILDISKIESGQSDIQRVVFSPFEVVSDVVGLLRNSAEKKGVNLQIEVDPQVPLLATSDPIRIRQILVNLIGNAVKFTPMGSVVIHIKADEEKYIIFEVQDMGIGIAEKDIKNLFYPFSQADGTVNRKFGGSGLGLFISKRLAERLGGNVILSASEEHKGSKFIAKINAFPFVQNKAEVEITPKATIVATPFNESSLFGTRVLLAEDVLDNQVLMRMYLEKAGVEVEIANNGEEAIDAALHNNYDLILMDIQMPGTDGLQATKQLRLQGFNGPIVALSANAMSDDVNRSIAAGCNAHLTKPISKLKLIEAVNNFRVHH